MFQEEEFEGHEALTEQRKSFYRASDFKVTDKERAFAKGKTNIIAELLVYAGCGIIIGLAFSVAHYREEMKQRDRTINILKADNERLLHSSHNPFVHARK